MKNQLMALLLLLFLAACSEDYYLFDDMARLQFGPEAEHIYQTNYQFRDTLKSFTFVYEAPEKQFDTMYYDLYLMGQKAEFDRPFRLEQVQGANTSDAQPGKHYVPFDDGGLKALYVIRAGETHVRVPIVLIRDTSLQEEGVMLQFQLVANEYFELGDHRLIWRKAFFIDKFIRPTLWDAFLTSSYLGPYSTVKHQFMIEQSGERWDEEFFTQIYNEFSTLLFWNARLKQLLIDHNNVNPGQPLRDESGELVFFP